MPALLLRNRMNMLPRRIDFFCLNYPHFSKVVLEGCVSWPLCCNNTGPGSAHPTASRKTLLVSKLLRSFSQHRNVYLYCNWHFYTRCIPTWHKPEIGLTRKWSDIPATFPSMSCINHLDKGALDMQCDLLLKQGNCYTWTVQISVKALFILCHYILLQKLILIIATGGM